MNDVLKRFFTLLSPDKMDILYIQIYGIASGLISLTLPLGVQAIIGLVMAGAISSSWVLLVVLVTAGIFVTGGLQMMQIILTEIIQQRIFVRSAMAFASRIPKFKIEALSKYYPPELVNRFFDTLTIQKGIPKVTIDITTALFQIFFGITLLSFYHPFFIFFGVGNMVVLYLIFHFSWNSGLRTSIQESTHKYELAHWLEEIARTMETFKLSGNISLPLKFTDILANNYIKVRKKHFRVILFLFINSVIFRTILTGGLLLIGGILVIDMELSIGQFVAAEIVIILIGQSIEKLVRALETIFDVLTATHKIGYVMDIPVERSTGVDFDSVDTGKGMEIAIQDLSFSYTNASKETLKGIDFKMKSGERVCLAGYNASGKTTLINLVSGLFQDFGGNITYNGVPLRNLNIESVREHIGDVLTQEMIFPGTIEQNITMDRPNVNFVHLKEVSDQLGLDEYVRNLPLGYNTYIKPEGSELPRSIARLIIIARAVVHEPKLLVVEEVMHNLQRNIKENISNFLTAKKQPWSILVVSNDPIMASKCDRVVVLKEGEIIADAPHEEIKEMDFYPEIFI